VGDKFIQRLIPFNEKDTKILLSRKPGYFGVYCLENQLKVSTM